MKKCKLVLPFVSIVGLTTSLVPVLSLTSCGEQGLTDTEKTTVSVMNKCISNVGSNLKTTHQAVVLINNYLGIDASTFKFENSNYYFAFDIDKKCFIVMSGDNLVLGPTDDYKLPTNNLTHIFKFVTPTTLDVESKYSQYLTYSSNYEESYVVKTGIDVGYNRSIENLTYECNPLIEKSVTLNTYCDVVTINGGKDTVKHYGMTNNIFIKSSNHYWEYGEAAYVSVESKSTINLGYVDDKTLCDIDIIEVKDAASESVLASKETGAYVGSSIGVMLETSDHVKLSDHDLSTTKKTITTTDELVKAFTMDASGGFSAGYGFMRLESDIDLDQKITFTLSDADPSRLLVLDLNGHSINDTATGLAAGEALIELKDNTTSYNHIPLCLNILDTQRKDDKCISLKNHNINISGTKCGAAVALDGAKIKYEADTAINKSAAFIVGYDADDTTTLNYSYLYVYGGGISASVKSGSSSSVTASAVIYRSKGTTVQTNYGTIYGESACFIGDQGKDAYSNAKLEISGGSVISDSICIYNPLDNIVDIYGGYLQGNSCVGMKDGDLTITGGYLKANGTNYHETVTTSLGIDINGSVILFDGNKKVSGEPTIRVSNATLETISGNIISGCMNTDSSTGFVGNYLSVFFTSGTYYWHENQYKMTQLENYGCCSVTIGSDSVWIKK